ncbi:hypothetical protein HanIR_Chr15g0737051 [Helianthus annuus]|nr:hypothetical protein HanIR_Chr15g0737051 [Helianthus annuus]
MDDGGGFWCWCCSGGGIVAKWERSGLPMDAFEVNQTPLFIARTEPRPRPRLRWARPVAILLLFLHLKICQQRAPLNPVSSGHGPVVNSSLYYQDSANLRVDHAPW